MTGAATDDITTIAELLAALRARVPQSGIGRGRELLAEVRDGLDDAAAAYRSAGLSPAAAERRAVSDFGTAELDRIAQECQAELGTSATLRAAVAIGLGYPAMIAGWALYGALSGAVTRFHDGSGAGMGFTIVGAVSVLLALATIAVLRHDARAAGRARPATTGRSRVVRRLTTRVFAVLALASILATYVLALLSHRPRLGSSAVAFAELATEGLSLAITFAMAVAVIRSVRTVRPGEFSVNCPRAG